MGYWNYSPYVSVGEKKAKAAKKLAQLKKKNPDIQPVCIEGRTIARTWWGKSWNANLERYADYSNRIGRGRSYVCNGMVLDLQIAPGKVSALVQGTRANPYEVAIQIAGIAPARWKKIKAACDGRFDALSELLEGRFPEALGDIFMARGEGLFPAPEEIKFSCSCPDWASMCKHVAAALYGIGARLDQDPMLFFALRHVDVNELVTRAVKDKTRKLLDKAEKKSARVIQDADLGDMFGITIDEPVAPFEKKPGKQARRKKTLSKAASRSADPENRAAVNQSSASGRKPAGKTRKPVDNVSQKATAKTRQIEASSPLPSPVKPADIIEGIINKSRKGVNFAALEKQSGLPRMQIRNIIYQLKQKGRIITPERGLYMKARAGKGMTGKGGKS